MLRLGRGGEGGQQRKPRVRDSKGEGKLSGEGTVLKPRGKKCVRRGWRLTELKPIAMD